MLNIFPVLKNCGDELTKRVEDDKKLFTNNNMATQVEAQTKMASDQTVADKSDL